MDVVLCDLIDRLFCNCIINAIRFVSGSTLTYQNYGKLKFLEGKIRNFIYDYYDTNVLDMRV